MVTQRHGIDRNTDAYLVVDHVLEALVVRRAHEDRARHLLARPGVVEDLVAQRLDAVLAQHAHDVVHRAAVERRRVAPAALRAARLAQDALHQLPDRHAARNRVRVDDDVRHDPARRKRHLVLRVQHAHRALLACVSQRCVRQSQESQESQRKQGAYRGGS